MVYYREKTGKIIYSAETVGELSDKTGLSKREILQRIRARHVRVEESKGTCKTFKPYFDADDYYEVSHAGMQNRFLRLHFAGKTKQEIMDAMYLDEKMYRYYHTELLGPLPEDSKETKQRNMRDKFWDEWDEVRLSLLKSGANLQIPITLAD